MFALYKFYPENFDPEKHWDDKYAQEHAAGISGEEFSKQDFWPLLESQLKKDGRYLDAGCGIGGWIIFLKEKGFNVEGIDVRARTLRALSEYDPDLKVKMAGMTSIPYADNSLDGILVIGTLEYVENKVEVALTEANRVLKENGFFFIEVPNENTLRKMFYLPFKSLEKTIKAALGKKATFRNYLFDRKEFVELLKKNNFEAVEVKPHELPNGQHFGLYVDFPFFRGSKPYYLNVFGNVVRKVLDVISPWVCSTGIVIVAKKR